MVARKQKLADSLRLQQLFRDVEDEETWIREKEPVAASTNRGVSKRESGWDHTLPPSPREARSRELLWQ